MNNQSPESASPPEPLSRREARRQRREERLARGGSGWIVGVILIVLGGLFLVQDTGMFSIPISNWWALFILIPAVGAFDRAWRAYREADNRITVQVGGAVLVGIVLLLVTLGFLINISWTYFGPILIILAGLGILVSSMMGGKEKPS